jgi:Tfp pilus assembly protein PilX
MIRRLAHEESGVALVLALLTMLVLASLTTAVSLEVTVNHRNAGRSAEANKAFALAELGLAYAEGKVYSAASTHVSPTVPSTSFTQDGGTVNYFATVAADGITWTMTGSGTYDGITKTVTAQANVPSSNTTTDPSVWNYLYADSTSSCTTISGSTVVSVPLITRGDFCLTSSASFTGTQLEAGGTVTVSSSKGIGTSGTPIATLNVGSTCNSVTPGTGTCDGAHSPIYANHVSATLSVSPHMPPLDLATAYATTNPGPASGHACQAGSGVPSPFFDNDTTLNNSVASVNLFPNSDYDCKVGTSEIKWTHSTNTLYLNGEFFFDGSFSNNGGTTINYTGEGSLYFTGTFQIGGSFSICGIASCTQLWNPDQNGIIIVAGCWANSTGSSLVTFAGSGSYCVDFNGTNDMQVGTYCATDYHIKGSATNMGPVLANTLTLGGSTSSLIPFHVMPPGTPLNSITTYLPAQQPKYWNG